MKVGRTLGLNKFKSLAVGDWRKSKYVFVISAIQTALYQINDCIENILHCLNNLGYFVSIINDASHLFSKENKVDLSKQQNYVCLIGCDDDIDIDIEELVAQAPLVKQRSQQWFLIRKEAKVTGSTANAALGLDTLKAQQTHYDKVFENVTSPEPTAEAKERMDYGTANEINALATLMSKCLPIYYPEVLYVEEGCHIIQHEGKPFMVVSPDGGGRSFVNDGRHSHLSSAILAIEAKCPFPDKKYTTQVTYKLPRYYVAQVMCEMKALGVSHLLFICYSKESSTLFLVSYDDILWNLMWEEFVTIYGKTAPQRPKRKSSKLTALADRIRYFIDQKVEFLCEIPSVEAIECGHGISTDSPSTKGHNVHIPTEAYTRPVDTVLLSDLLEQLAKCERWIKESHELCRTRASEVLVFLIADLNRFYKEEVPHSIPIAYGLKGYSLKVDCLRAMLFEILKLCKEQKLYTPVISFDGQWSKITVRAANGDPLTVLQLQKDVWNEACKMSKTAIQQYLFSLNIISEVHSLSDIKTKVDIDVEFEIGSRRNTLYVDCVKGPSKPFVMSKELNDELQNQKQNHNLSSNLEEDEKRNDPSADASLLDSLGNSNNIVVDEDIIEQASSITLTQKETHSSNQFPLENHSDEVSDAGAKSNLENEMQINPFLTDTQFHDMILNLQESKFREKWIGETKEGLFAKLSSKDKISKHFTKIEMQICLKSIKDTLKNEGITFSLSWSKCRLAEYFVVLMTDSDSLPRKSPKGVKLLTLKKLCQSKVRGWSKHMLNIAFAQHIFPQRFQMWRKSSIFRDNCFIHGLDTNIRWYSKPEYVPELDQHLFAILDSEHLLVNARAKVCSTGMKARGISREAWVKVARKSKINGTGLNLALVEDLVDKQKCAYALKTFSKEVESELSLNGDENEARFCRCLREWYSSEDDPGISAEQRCEKRLMFRHWLLQGVKFNNFPPPGQFVKDIPLIMFEGFLNNIDRRLQLFPMVTTGSYCVRALGSLECENLFGSFQDLDPSGSGVIKPDDIPLAMNTALEILRARMDPNRCFFMNTSKAKCYPVHDLIAKSDSVNSDEFKIPDFVDHISPRNHAFDLPERRKRNPKRKNSEISGPSMPSSGIKPVRQHHKCDESKILPSTRLGLDISEL